MGWVGSPDGTARCRFAPGLPLYLVVFVLAFFSPLAAVMLTLALEVFYLPSASLFAER
jgi:hypothetical protein